MSGKPVDPNVQRRRLLVRCGLGVVYAALIAIVFNFGKGHTLIIDNQDAEDGSVKAIESLSVSVDGQEAIDLQGGDRDMAKVRGQGHVVEITVGGQKTSTRIRVPLNEDMLLLSLPKLLAGQPAVIPFVPKDVAPPADDAGNSNAFTSPMDPAASGAPDAAPVAPPVP
jgi:hypothetical protein